MDIISIVTDNRYAYVLIPPQHIQQNMPAIGTLQRDPKDLTPFILVNQVMVIQIVPFNILDYNIIKSYKYINIYILYLYKIIPEKAV